MNVIVGAFYADIPDKPSRLGEFLPLIRASKTALQKTNPDARYVILTDVHTSNLLPKDIEFSVVCPVYMPLMLKIVLAQRFFVRTTIADLIILPDVDCLANRDLSVATPDNVGFATTHRGFKFEYRINNVAYIRDTDLAFWFFSRAYDKLKGFPVEKHHWDGGDQESWEAALEPPPSPAQWYSYEDLGDDILLSRPEGRDIYVYPCETHNCMMPDGGMFKPKHFDSFMVHFKGPRKQHLDKWMTERFNL